MFNVTKDFSDHRLKVLYWSFLEICFFTILQAFMYHEWISLFKVGLSPSKKICVICFSENLLKMMKNAFYFILKALFVLKMFKFLS